MIDSKHLKPNIPSSKLLEIPQEFGWGLSADFSTPLNGAVESDRIVGDFECSEVRLTLNSGDTTSVVSVDVLKDGVSIFETPVSIDISGTTSFGATTPFIFTFSANTITFYDDNRVDFIVSGATDCKGLKVKLIGNRLINTIYDSDAQTFIDAVGTLTVPQETAINDLVIGLKANGTWSKYHAIYPMIGGTASSHKWNLKDPRDLDSSFRLTFNGSWVHSSDGAKGDGSTAYADTYFVDSVHLIDAGTYINISVGYYSNLDISGTFNFSTELGNRGEGAYQRNDEVNLEVNDGGGSWVGAYSYADNYGAIINYKYAQISALNGDVKYFEDGTFISNMVTQTVATFADRSFYLNSARGLSGPANTSYSPRNCAYAYIADGLTDTEIIDDYVVIQTYQTTLNRQV